MSIISDLCDDAVWDRFLEIKRKHSKDSADELLLASFILNRGYRPIVDSIAEGRYVFSDPMMIEVPKSDGSKRAIYTFRNGNDIAEHTVLRVMAWLLERYDTRFAPNLYCLGRNDGVEGTVIDLLSVKGLEDKYMFKFDISNYGNSIEREQLMMNLREFLDPCDSDFADVVDGILSNPRVYVQKLTDGRIERESMTVEKKGAMAGLPLGTFFMYMYLNRMDWYFHEKNIPYCRFNDDILVVGDTEEEVLRYKEKIIEYINDKGLATNEKKMLVVRPGDRFDYLGLSFRGKDVTVTENVVRRKKSQLRAHARKYDKMARNGEMSRDAAMDMMITYINGSFLSNESPWTFSRIYFPRITSSEHLDEIDGYAQDCIRFVRTGRFRESNRIKVPYRTLSERGYVPLVSAYRMFREERKGRHGGVKGQMTAKG